MSRSIKGLLGLRGSKSSAADEAVPVCMVCERSAGRPWSRLGLTQRRQWQRAGASVLCKACAAHVPLAQHSAAQHGELHHSSSLPLARQPGEPLYDNIKGRYTHHTICERRSRSTSPTARPLHWGLAAAPPSSGRVAIRKPRSPELPPIQSQASWHDTESFQQPYLPAAALADKLLRTRSAGASPLSRAGSAEQRARTPPRHHPGGSDAGEEELGVFPGMEL